MLEDQEVVILEEVKMVKLFEKILKYKQKELDRAKMMTEHFARNVKEEIETHLEAGRTVPIIKDGDDTISFLQKNQMQIQKIEIDFDALPSAVQIALNPPVLAPFTEDDFKTKFEGDNYKLYQMDAIDFLKNIDDESVDLVITDPAYESLEKHRKIGTKTRLVNKWFPIFTNDRFGSLFQEIFRVLKNNTHFYMFSDVETMFVVKPIAEQAGFKFWKPIIWNKLKIGMGYHFRNQYECILFFEKGKRKLNDLGIGDIITCPRIRGDFPTEKPVMVNEILVKQSSNTNELVIDPFAGTCSSGISTLQNNRKYIGNDIGEEVLKYGNSRIIELIKGLNDQNS